MQFFALILINIAMFAIFYLLISLKLERKATEFREKRMRRIMEEMINEFNETAERNISILENRINTLRRLLKISGEVSSLDVRLMDDMPSAAKEEKKSPADRNPKVFSEEAHSRMMTASATKPNTGGLLKAFIQDGADAISKGFKTFLHRTRSASIKDQFAVSETFLGSTSHEKEMMKKVGQYHQKTRDDDAVAAIDHKKNEFQNDEDLTALFSAAGDKYALVSDLYARGYSIESIARSSGIPQGEIRLVLNLGMQ